jgi:hypothetical protein
MVERQFGQVIEIGRIAGWAAASATVLTVLRRAMLRHSRPSAMWLLTIGVPTLLAGVTIARLVTIAIVWVRLGGHP